MDFKPSKADPDILMKLSKDGPHYEYIAVYVDDCQSNPNKKAWSIWLPFLLATVCNIDLTLKTKLGQWLHTGTNLHHQWETMICPKTHTLIIH